MNKKVFYLVTAISSLTVAIIVGIFLALTYNVGSGIATKTSIEIHKTYLDEMIYNYKNDLVSGNYRFFRNQITALIDRNVFSDYQIVQNEKVLDSTETYALHFKEPNYFEINIPIWYNEAKTEKWGTVNLLVNDKIKIDLANVMLNQITFFVFLSLLLLAVLAALYFYVWQKINLSLSLGIQSIFVKKTDDENGIFSLIWKPILDQLRSLKSDYDNLISRAKEIERQEVLLKISRQLAHDIRSPLTAIEAAIANTGSLPKENLELLRGASQRIKNIATDLLEQSHPSGNIQVSFSDQPLEIQSFDLAQGIKQIISEKASEGVSVKYVQIESTMVVGNVSDFMRIISNLLNNCIDAVEQIPLPSIEIAIRLQPERVVVYIIDNGKGIPEDLVLKVGSRGFTHGKAKGNGLGISSAREKLESWGGDLFLTSKEGQGTMVTIRLVRQFRSQ